MGNAVSGTTSSVQSKSKGFNQKHIAPIVGQKNLDAWDRSWWGGKYANVAADWLKGGKDRGPGVGGPTDMNGNPLKSPTHDSIMNKNGTLKSQYRLGDVNPWVKMQEQRQGLEQKTMMNDTIKNALAGQGQAESALAMRGGLSGGARERMLKNNMRDANLNKNAVNLQGNVNRLDLQKMGFEKNREAEQFNIQNMLQDKNAKMERDIAKYQADMQAWGAGKTADATAKSGKGK